MMDDWRNEWADWILNTAQARLLASLRSQAPGLEGQESGQTAYCRLIVSSVIARLDRAIQAEFLDRPAEPGDDSLPPGHLLRVGPTRHRWRECWGGSA
ncbi:hypothetical protein JXA88_13020 [Candidatus Fermentibacteria bacterium]|nr:hypothetical protein [Candidatus Fermentibacteria bacterium]